MLLYRHEQSKSLEWIVSINTAMTFCRQQWYTMTGGVHFHEKKKKRKKSMQLLNDDVVMVHDSMQVITDKLEKQKLSQNQSHFCITVADVTVIFRKAKVKHAAQTALKYHWFPQATAL